MKYRDYYEILGVKKDATQDDIKKAFRKLAKAYHPDAHPGDKTAEEKFKEINEAYEVLGNEEKRRKYDRFGNEYHFANGSDFDPSQFGFNGRNGSYTFRGSAANGFSDFFDMFFGDGGLNLDEVLSGRGRSGFSNAGFGSSGFGGGAYAPGFQSKQPQRGEDKEVEVKLSVLDGLKGEEKRITLETPGGRKTLSIRIPKGIQPGGKIRIGGHGGKGQNGGPDGDLLLVVRFKEDDYSLTGTDITMQTEVYPWIAALGGDKTVSTPDGRLSVSIPAGIRNGHKIRIPGKGYPNAIGGRGDLFIAIKIDNPVNLSSDQKKLYQQLKDLG